MILEDPAPTPPPWWPNVGAVAQALLVAAATAIGTELGKWAIEAVKARAHRGNLWGTTQPSSVTLEPQQTPEAEERKP